MKAHEIISETEDGITVKPYDAGYKAWADYLSGKTKERPVNPYEAGKGMHQWELGAEAAADAGDYTFEAEDNDTVYKNWRKEVGTDKQTTRDIVSGKPSWKPVRNMDNELAAMNKKLAKKEDAVSEDAEQTKSKIAKYSAKIKELRNKIKELDARDVAGGRVGHEIHSDNVSRKQIMAKIRQLSTQKEKLQDQLYR